MRSVKRDPAPSRWAWRLERLMLTPGVRLLLRAGVPFVVALGLGTAYFSQTKVQDKFFERVAEMRASFEERPEFMVKLMAIDGADEELATAIRAMLPVDLPVSSFDLDLETMRAQLMEMPPVKAAILRVRPGGVLQVEITPRIPVVIWRSDEGLQLLDDTGALVRPVASRAARPDLPVIAGDGADLAVAEARALLYAAAPLGTRMRGLVRMGARRWDLVLDRDQRVLLPETGAVAALERLIAMDKANEVLARDIKRVDLRLSARPTIRMQARATDERWRIRELNFKPE